MKIVCFPYKMAEKSETRRKKIKSYKNMSSIQGMWCCDVSFKGKFSLYGLAICSLNDLSWADSACCLQLSLADVPCFWYVHIPRFSIAA
jgi:hypothetical protein